MSKLSRNINKSSSEQPSTYQQMKLSQDCQRSGDRISQLYPGVNEDSTPFPRYWNGKEKYNTITLSQNNLRVHFKEPKNNAKTTEKDATSVQANHPIPTVCGLYYFEVKIVSKGRDGYIGIGLSASSVSAARLPGWDKFSFGYHGDDGQIFSATGTGQPYGPTFTTGDVVGCGVNYIDGNCFFTKNGHNLGIAFHDVPLNLYPTVGLQTPGEIIDANFGQDPFVYNIENDIREMEQKTFNSIRNHPIPSNINLHDQLLPKYIADYLVHQGYCSTAEAFSRATNQKLSEDYATAHTREKIKNLVLSGHINKAIEMTKINYPKVFETNENLLFLLKCRQFIEMINGVHTEYGTLIESESHTKQSLLLSSLDTDNSIQMNSNMAIDNDMRNDPVANINDNLVIDHKSVNNNSFDMDISDDIQNGNIEASAKNNGNSNTSGCNDDEDLQNRLKIRKILDFGRELYLMNQRLRHLYGANEKNEKILQDAFSLMAYSDPKNSPVGWQLDPKQRVSVCDHLNSAILVSLKRPARPSLEIFVEHVQGLVKHMVDSKMSIAAYLNKFDPLLNNSSSS